MRRREGGSAEMLHYNKQHATHHKYTKESGKGKREKGKGKEKGNERKDLADKIDADLWRYLE